MKRLSSAVRLGCSFSERNRIVISLFLFFVTWKTFVTCLGNDFANYDDPSYVLDNQHVTSGLSTTNIFWAFSSSTVGNWHPFTMLTHMLDWQLYGAKPWGHHLLNVVVHCFNTVLTFLLLHRITGGIWRSFWVALFFGLHPLRVESVAWIAERKDVLSTCFFLMTALAYTNYVARASTGGGSARKAYLLAVLCFLIGLLCKPMLVTLPCILLLLDYWPLERWRNERLLDLLKEKIPFILLSGAVSVLTCVTQGPGMYPLKHMSIYVRLENLPVAYCRYLAKIYYPVNLAVLYPYPRYWPGLLVIVCALLFLAIWVTIVMVRRRCPYILVGWLWFFGALFPVIGLVQTGTQSMADRYSYIPSIGINILTVWFIWEIAKRRRLSSIGACMIAVVLAVTCSLLTRQQIQYWKDGDSLWRHAGAVTEKNYTASYLIGLNDFARGHYDLAISNLEHAVSIKGNMIQARLALAGALKVKGLTDDALRVLNRAAQIDGGNAQVRIEIGRAWLAKGHRTEAITNLVYALKLHPKCPEAEEELRKLTNSPVTTSVVVAGTNSLPAMEPTNAERR